MSAPRLARVGVMWLLVMGAASCARPTEPALPTTTTGYSGGTLRIGATGDPRAIAAFAFADPAQPTFGQLLRCCLARTPLTYPGTPTADGGTVLQPDLAAEMPDVSSDGLAWTIRLRSGIRYAPPYADVEVTATDVVRGAERAARLQPDVAFVPGAPLEFVSGAAAYAEGRAATISGLEARDTHTLVVRLTRPYGGFGILADAVWAPIPEALAVGHDEDMGVYWASTGPYMYEAYPADATSERVVLVRNTSWDAATDPRRRAWVNRIEIAFAGDVSEAFGRLETGEFDFLDTSAAADVVDRYRLDANLTPRLRTAPSQTIAYLPMNLAVPPFDDRAVRRAVNAVLDRARLRDLILEARERERGRPQQPGVLAGHVFPDHLTANLLVGYDPFGAQDGGADLARARVEMSASRYDTDGDGLCDDAICSGVQMPTVDAAVGESIKSDLAKIGIAVEVVPWSETNDMSAITSRTPIQANTFVWGYTLTGSDLAVVLRGGEALAASVGFAANQSLVGARSEDLAAWGYDVTEVPGVDDVIDRCDAEIGHLRAECWAELDQLVTEAIVPWVPLFSFESAHVASARVAEFSLDQSLFAAFPALDRVMLREGEQ